MTQLKILPTESESKTRTKSGLFSKACMMDCINQSPQFPETDSMDVLKNFLKDHLPYNSVETRQRFAMYVLHHLFPSGVPDAGFMLFAKHFGGTQALRDVCLYRICQAQSMMSDFIDEIMLPSIGKGVLAKNSIRDFLTEKVSGGKAKSILSCSGAIQEVLTSTKLARIEKSEVSFRFRKPTLESFCFIVHSEFGEPSMHDLKKLEQNQAFTRMLWNRDELLPALYELRNAGILSKISEIDSVRQFTTRWKLEESVRQLVDLRK